VKPCSVVVNSPHHLSNSEDFVRTLGTLQVQPNDILVSFDVVSLFTGMPTRDSLKLMIRGDIRIFHLVLITSSFCFNGQFHEQTDGVAMGSPLSPVTANFFTQDSEAIAPSRAAFKPTCCRHLDDTFVMCPMDPKS